MHQDTQPGRVSSPRPRARHSLRMAIALEALPDPAHRLPKPLGLGPGGLGGRCSTAPYQEGHWWWSAQQRAGASHQKRRAPAAEPVLAVRSHDRNDILGDDSEQRPFITCARRSRPAPARRLPASYRGGDVDGCPHPSAPMDPRGTTSCIRYQRPGSGARSFDLAGRCTEASAAPALAQMHQAVSASG